MRFRKIGLKDGRKHIGLDHMENPTGIPGVPKSKEYMGVKAKRGTQQGKRVKNKTEILCDIQRGI